MSWAIIPKIGLPHSCETTRSQHDSTVCAALRLSVNTNLKDMLYAGLKFIPYISQIVRTGEWYLCFNNITDLECAHFYYKLGCSFRYA